MISYKALVKRINQLNNKFSLEKDKQNAQMIAKLAVIEVSGWIEQYIDDQIEKNVINKLNFARKFYREKIEDNSSFAFGNIRSLTILDVGCVKFDRLVCQKCGLQCIATLKGNLRTLVEARNTVAHTSVDGITSILAPGRSLQLFADIYRDLSKYFRELNKMKAR